MDRDSLEGRKVRTLDDALLVYEDRDFSSAILSQLARGAEIQLGAAVEVDGREWIEAAFPDGKLGYVLGSSTRSHTTPVATVEQNEKSVPDAVVAAPVFSARGLTSPMTLAPTGDLQGGTGLGRTVQDLIVTGFGLVTSSLTALILALVETKLGFAFYSFTLLFVIPVGALLSGFAAASGYYLGAKVFDHRPTRLMLFNMMSVAVTTYFLLNYLNYSLLEVKGQLVSELIPFGQYLGIVLSHQSMEFRNRAGVKFFETGELGVFGYVIAAVQVLGFAVGGLSVYRHLRAAPYCGSCGKYLKKQTTIIRHTNDVDQLKGLYSGLMAELQMGKSASAAQLISGFGTAKQNVKDLKLNTKLKLWKCPTCPQEFSELSVNQWNGKDWKPVSGLLLRDYLPRT